MSKYLHIACENKQAENQKKSKLFSKLCSSLENEGILTTKECIGTGLSIGLDAFWQKHHFHRKKIDLTTTTKQYVKAWKKSNDLIGVYFTKQHYVPNIKKYDYLCRKKSSISSFRAGKNINVKKIHRKVDSFIIKKTDMFLLENIAVIRKDNAGHPYMWSKLGDSDRFVRIIKEKFKKAKKRYEKRMKLTIQNLNILYERNVKPETFKVVKKLILSPYREIKELLKVIGGRKLSIEFTPTGVIHKTVSPYIYKDKNQKDEIFSSTFTLSSLRFDKVNNGCFKKSKNKKAKNKVKKKTFQDRIANLIEWAKYILGNWYRKSFFYWLEKKGESKLLYNMFKKHERNNIGHREDYDYNKTDPDEIRKFNNFHRKKNNFMERENRILALTKKMDDDEHYENVRRIQADMKIHPRTGHCSFGVTDDISVDDLRAKLDKLTKDTCKKLFEKNANNDTGRKFDWINGIDQSLAQCNKEKQSEEAKHVKPVKEYSKEELDNMTGEEILEKLGFRISLGQENIEKAHKKMEWIENLANFDEEEEYC